MTDTSDAADEPMTPTKRPRSRRPRLLAVIALLVLGAVLLAVGMWDGGAGRVTAQGAAPTRTTPPGWPTRDPELDRLIAFRRSETPPAGLIPTRTVPPDATPTRVRTPAPTASPLLPTPTYVVVTPGAAWTTYTDPNFGFSFTYPANWFFDPPKERITELRSEGYGLMLTNYAHVPDKRAAKPSNEIKIEIT